MKFLPIPRFLNKLNDEVFANSKISKQIERSFCQFQENFQKRKTTCNVYWEVSNMRDMWQIFKDKTLVFIKVDSNNVCWFHIQKFNKSLIHILGWQWLWILILFKNRYENSLYVWCKIWREGMKGRKWNRGDLIPSFQNRDGE